MFVLPARRLATMARSGLGQGFAEFAASPHRNRLDKITFLC
jgi:hypothetical protein